MSRRIVVELVLISFALAGCSVTTRPAQPHGLVCVRAHDEYHEGRSVVICDEYKPNSTPGRP